EDGFKIERKKDAGAYAQIATFAANTETYTNTNLSPDSIYTYRVRAYNAGGNSAYSNEATGHTLPTIPAAPGNLTAQPVSATAIDLKWQDQSINEDGFKLQRRKDAGGYGQIATPTANATTFSDVTGLAANSTYTYRICAYNAGGQSGFSGEAIATT